MSRRVFGNSPKENAESKEILNHDLFILMVTQTGLNPEVIGVSIEKIQAAWDVNWDAEAIFLEKNMGFESNVWPVWISG